MSGNRSTAMALVKAECVNYRNKRCNGIDIWSKFTVPLPTCLIKLGLPCSYFDRCLLLLALRRARWAGAAEDYVRRLIREPHAAIQRVESESLRHLLARHPFVGHHEKFARLMGDGDTRRRCGCGAPLAKQQRYCAGCRQKRRRRSYRESKKRRRRQRRGQVSTVRAIPALAQQGLTTCEVHCACLSQGTPRFSHLTVDMRSEAQALLTAPEGTKPWDAPPA